MKINAELIDQANLTRREGEILCLICEGYVDKAIAKKLAISIKTVSAHIESIYIKMAVREQAINVRCAAITHALVRGMVRLSSTLLCVWLMVASVTLDDPAIRLPVARVMSARVKRDGDA